MMMLSVSSEDPSVAEVNGYGGNGKVFLVNAIKEGETNLTITAERDEIKYTASCHVTVVSEDRTEPADQTPQAETEASGIPPQTKVEPAVMSGSVRKAQPMTVKAKKPKVKASKLVKKKRKIKRKKAFTIKNAKGKVTFRKKSGSRRLKINQKTGTVTVKKGTKKGTYKIRVIVTAAGNAYYEAGSRTVTVKVRVK